MMNVVRNSLSINTIYIIIIIIIRQELCLDRYVLAWSNSLYKCLPRRLRQFGLQFSIIFGILLLFILVTCRRQFHLYLLSFSSIGSTFISSKNFLIPFVVQTGVLYCRLMSIFFIIFLRVQNSLPYRIIGITSALSTFILENFWTKLGFYMKISFCINLHENTTDILHITMWTHTKAI
jgi:hypothetical protein